jgi:hypothetical protein
MGIISVDFDATGQLIIHSAFAKYLRKYGNKMKQCISYLWTSSIHMIKLGERYCLILALSLVFP